MEKEIFRIELEKQIEILETVGEQLDNILQNNPWEILRGKIVFDDWNVQKVYRDTMKTYISYSNLLKELESLCKDNGYLDVLKDIAMLKFEKGII